MLIYGYLNAHTYSSFTFCLLGAEGHDDSDRLGQQRNCVAGGVGGGRDEQCASTGLTGVEG